MNKKLLYGILVLFIGFVSACSNSDEYISNIQDDVQKVIYSELFSDSITAFTAVKVSGEQEWVYDSRGYAYFTGYVGGQNLANEDWLISPVIDLSDVDAAHFTFDHVARYFGDLATEATVWVSEDYTDGMPSTATWTQVVTPPFVDPGSWTFSNSGELSLTQYAGKKIRIAFKYVSTTTKAGSWEIKNFVVSSGEAVVVEHNYGEGTKESPYNVLGGIANQTGANAWVKGYIVGYVVYGNPTNFYFTSENCTTNTNILIADSATGFYVSQSIAVQLPTGAVRNGLNLVNNPTLIGKKVTMYGTLTSYFGMGGLKNVSYYVLEDGTSGGSKPFDPANAIFYETFASSLGQFTAESVTGNQVWAYNATYKCAIMNGYASGARYVNDDWLITPSVSLPAAKDAVLSFEMAGKYFYGTITNNITLFISTDYVSGSPSTATWTQLTIPTYDTSDNFTFTNTGDINLSAYKGQNVRIAIKYTSDGTSTGTGQIEIKNFVIE